MTITSEASGNWSWRDIAVLIARLVFAAMFLMAVTFKLMDPNGTAAYIAAAGFPFPTLLTWLAILLEVAIVLAFLTGACLSELAVIAAIYVIFLGFAFHGPSLWAANQAEFGAFVSHFPFGAGLLYAAAHGPGRKLAIHWRLLP